MSQIRKITLIGLGIMGKSMARNLRKHGFEVCGYARNPERAADLAAEGMPIFASIKEAVAGSDAVITIVGYPSDVEEVYRSEQGIFANVAAGAYLIDMTTSSPTLAKELADEGAAKGFHVVDAPVTGGDTGAKAGTLSILVGGTAEDYQVLLPMFQAMGTNINHMGAAGAGQHAKLANQIVIAGTISGVAEALAYAKDKGLDLDTLFQAISTGAAGSFQLTSNGRKMIDGDFAPGFFIKHFIKDMRLAAEEADRDRLKLEILSKTLENYRKLEDDGLGELGTQALSKLYDFE